MTAPAAPWQRILERYLESLLLERGLAHQTIDSYRRDLRRMGETLAEEFDLLFVIAGWTMGRVKHVLPRLLVIQQTMLSDQFNTVVVNHERIFGQSHRHQDADPLPRHRISVLAVEDESFHIHHAIDHLRSIEVVLRQ